MCYRHCRKYQKIRFKQTEIELILMPEPESTEPEQQILVPEKITLVNIEDEMKRSYIDYAMSVIVGRALPDVRDGLKPVHRRVLFGMHDSGMQPNKPHRKCARIVGDVMGRSGIREAYQTGRGRIVVRAKVHTEQIRQGKTALIVTEIPYMVNKAQM